MHQTTVIEKEHNILDTRGQCFGSQGTVFWIPGGYWNGHQCPIRNHQHPSSPDHSDWKGAQYFGYQEDNILDPRRTLKWIPGGQCFGSQGTVFWIPGGYWNGYQEDNVLDPRSIVQLCHKILICLHTHIGIGKATVVELNWFGGEVYLGRCWMRLVEVKRSLDGVGIGIGRSRICCRDDGPIKQDLFL